MKCIGWRVTPSEVRLLDRMKRKIGVKCYSTVLSLAVTEYSKKILEENIHLRINKYAKAEEKGEK